MAAKDDLIIDLMEEEEEEWPEVGAQNPEEVEQYTEKINNVFDNLLTLIHQDTEDGFRTDNSKFQKDCGMAMGNHGGRRCGRHPQNHKRPHCGVFVAASDRWGSQGLGPPLKNCQQDRSLYDSYQNGPGGPKKQRSSWISSNMRHGPTGICQRFVPT